ncbi:hypothetical protein [Mariniflexile sp.]|uniref:hypothetical protein n=1 Tax=Mariniflexile sp. TaxID=1979402 RepID=UPI0040488389
MKSTQINYHKILLTLLFLFLGQNTQAQLLDKLKQRAEEKGLQTREVSFDSTDNAKNRATSYEEEELVINSASDFFTTDVVMKLYYDYENKAVIHTQYFDADAIAMRTEFPDPTKKPLFHDSKGYAYAYNEESGYVKVKLAPSDMMGFMTASMIPQAYKLPAQPYLEAFSALAEKEISLNFLILELAFIYKPSHFEDDSYYTPSKTKCNNSNTCTKFSYNDPEYPGSYIQFDDNGRLSELYINTINPEVKKEDHPTGRIVYTYQNVSVKLPDATEQSLMPGPFGKLMEKGLQPWKNNKKKNDN